MPKSYFFLFKVQKKLKFCERVFGLKCHLIWTLPSEQCPCFCISRLCCQCKGYLLQRSSWVWAPQQWVCSLTPLKAAPKPRIKAEVRGIAVIPHLQWFPPFSCKKGGDGHCRGHGHLCPSRGNRSQLGSHRLHQMRKEVGL